MFPNLPFLHLRNQTETDSEISCNRTTSLAAGTASSDFSHEVVGQFRHSVLLAAPMKHLASLLWASPFGIAINRVLAHCSSDQMIGVDTPRVVADVHDDWAIVRDFSVREDIRNAMRALAFVLPLQAAHKATIALVVQRCLPFPAVISATDRDLRPERFDLSWGNINTHRVLLTLGATPPAVSAARGQLVWCEQWYQIGRTV